MLNLENRRWNAGHPRMYRFALWLLVILGGWMLSPSAFAQDITVASPVNGTSTQPSIWVRAHNVGCGGLLPIYFGYSIDNSTTLIGGVTPYDIDVTNQAIGGGTHTVYFKSWTAGGLCPVVASTFTVGAPPAPAAPPAPGGGGGWIPSSANVAANLDQSGNWEYAHDGGTPGDSNGSTYYPANPPSGDVGRIFYVTYDHGGGEIYHISFGNNANATHFVYDTYVYVEDPANVENLEMDVNQVIPNNATVIYGTQCASGSQTWEFSTFDGQNHHWHPSNIPCNPKTWAANTWHHVQIASHRDGNGVVTYDWVNLDGNHSNFQNASGNSAEQLGWQPGDLLINFQVDGGQGGQGSGSVTSYLHTTNIYYW
jgi:hypothetical protein